VGQEAAVLRSRYDGLGFKAEECHAGRLNHVAIAVRDAEKAAKIYGGVRRHISRRAVAGAWRHTVFVTLPNTKIEFIQRLRGIPIANFSSATRRWQFTTFAMTCRHRRGARHPDQGGAGARHGQPRIGAHGKPVLFLHPKDFSGALVEIEQA